MERPRTLDPREYKNNIRHLIGTDNSQLNTHIILLAPITIQHHLVVHINLALVLVNGPLAIYHNSPFRRYESPLRPSPKPRSDRYLIRSQSNSRYYANSQYKPNINLPQQPPPNIHHSPSMEPKFKMIMYHQNTSSCSQCSKIQAKAITPSTWFVNFYLSKPPEDTSLPSKLELTFLLDIGASICVSNFPTFTILADHLLKCSKTNPQNDELKTLTVAKKAEVPVLFIVILTLHTSIHDSTRTLVIPFAVANIKYNILGNPLFEKYVKPPILNIYLSLLLHLLNLA